MRLVGISGSLRNGSYNSALLDAAAAELPAGVEFVRWHGSAQLPAFDEGRDGRDPIPAVAALRQMLAAADAVLVATPEYNGSIPGALKNALDWASRPYPNNCLRGKPVAIIGAATGASGAARAQAELRHVLTTIGATVLDQTLAVASAHAAFARNGVLIDRVASTGLRSILDGLVAKTGRLAA
jgi:chromate reductase